MNKVIDKGFRSCRFVSTIVKHPVHGATGNWVCDNHSFKALLHLIRVIYHILDWMGLQ